MGSAGMTDGRAIRPRHLWPKRFGKSFKQIREAFYEGAQFFDAGNRPITVNDLAPRTKVVIHVDTKSRLSFSL
jgi:hypothetical protein